MKTHSEFGSEYDEIVAHGLQQIEAAWKSGNFVQAQTIWIDVNSKLSAFRTSTNVDKMIGAMEDRVADSMDRLERFLSKSMDRVSSR